MSERAVLSLEQVDALKREAEFRDQTIVGFMLQVPDYPPLSACPTCGERPTTITSTAGTISDRPDTILIDFAPCGHGFRATAE